MLAMRTFENLKTMTILRIVYYYNA
jgi:hypothetical protein